MRRVVLATAAVATAAMSAVALATPPASRTVTAHYSLALAAQGRGVLVEGPVVGVVTTEGAEATVGFADVDVRKGDRFTSVRVTDDSGRVVRAVVQAARASGQEVPLAVFCASTHRRVALPAHTISVDVRPAYGECGSTPSVPTTGLVRVTLSR